MGKFIGYEGSNNCKWKISDEFYEKWKNYLVYTRTYHSHFGSVEQLDDYYDFTEMDDSTFEKFRKELFEEEKVFRSWMDDETREKIKKRGQGNDRQ